MNNISPLLGQLDINLDELENALEPLLEQALSETVNELSLLERAKLYVLITYTIESILFCTKMSRRTGPSNADD